MNYNRHRSSLVRDRTRILRSRRSCFHQNDLPHALNANIRVVEISANIAVGGPVFKPFGITFSKDYFAKDAEG